MSNNPPKNFSGVRSLIATLCGAIVGCLVAYFLSILINNAPTDIAPSRLRLFFSMIVASGAVTGFSIETTRQLQVGSSEPDYHQKNPWSKQKPKT